MAKVCETLSVEPSSTEPDGQQALHKQKQSLLTHSKTFQNAVAQREMPRHRTFLGGLCAAQRQCWECCRGSGTATGERREMDAKDSSTGKGQAPGWGGEGSVRRCGVGKPKQDAFQGQQTGKSPNLSPTCPDSRN